MEERNIDVLCITETWLLPHTPDNFINVSNYNVFRCDNGRGAGACIYVKDTLKANVIRSEVLRPQGIEDVWVTVQNRKLPAIIIGCMYRHPKAPAESFNYIEDIFRLMSIRNISLFILGDFNNNMLLHDNKLSILLKNNKLSQIIDKPTRVTATSAILLDLVITYNADKILSHDVVPQVIADHDLISINVNITKPKRLPIVRTFRHLGNDTQDRFCSIIIDSSSVN